MLEVRGGGAPSERRLTEGKRGGEEKNRIKEDRPSDRTEQNNRSRYTLNHTRYTVWTQQTSSVS